MTLTTTCTVCFFFFNDTATTEIYTLSLHDALPIPWHFAGTLAPPPVRHRRLRARRDRKSTRLNSSHVEISYAVFCLKKKNNQNQNIHLAYEKAAGTVSVWQVKYE